MKATYFDQEDTLVIRLSDKPIVREVSQDWNTHISYAEDGTAVELVVLEAHAHGVMPIEVSHPFATDARTPAGKPIENATALPAAHVP